MYFHACVSTPAHDTLSLQLVQDRPRRSPSPCWSCKSTRKDGLVFGSLDEGPAIPKATQSSTMFFVRALGRIIMLPVHGPTTRVADQGAQPQRMVVTDTASAIDTTDIEKASMAYMYSGNNGRCDNVGHCACIWTFTCTGHTEL